MPDKANLQIMQGDDWAAVVTVLNSDGSTPDLTGYTAQAQVRTNVADRTPVILVEITTTVTPPNLVTLHIDHADTVDLSRCYVWDCQITSPTGQITTILAGTVTVKQEVTRE